MTVRAAKVSTALVFALLAFGAVVTLSASVDRRSGDAAQAVAAGLSCPSCAGQSVAESDSPVAVSMRQTIAQQLGQGRTPDQVRDWFAGRYGPDVLRTGAGSGPSTLWLVPLIAVAGVAAAAVLTRLTRRAAVTDPRPLGIASHRRAVFVSVGGLATLVVAGVALSGWWIDRTPPQAAEPAVASPSEPLAVHLSNAEKSEAVGDFATAADEYRMASTLSQDPAIRLREAFSLLRAGQPKAAMDVAGAVRQDHPDDPDALLILGLAQRAAGDPEAEPTLTRFVAVSPGHPAVAEVRRLLAPNGG